MTIPSSIGRYRVQGELGRGGMGVVYSAIDPELDRQVAVKLILLPPDASPNLREELEKRFRREAKAAARIHHPGVVAIHDVGVTAEGLFLVMELVEGGSLADHLERGRFPDRAASIDMVARAAEALAAAHRAGLVHRDVKPANIMLASDGRVLLTDFGVARSLDEVSELTRTGMVVGSPAYMAPEQLQGAPVDGRADLFSLGVVLYELLLRKRPFPAQSITTLLYQILHEDPLADPNTLRELDPATALALRRLLAKRPDERFEDAAAAAAALRALPMVTGASDAPTRVATMPPTLPPVPGSAAAMPLAAPPAATWGPPPGSPAGGWPAGPSGAAPMAGPPMGATPPAGSAAAHAAWPAAATVASPPGGWAGAPVHPTQAMPAGWQSGTAPAGPWQPTPQGAWQGAPGAPPPPGWPTPAGATPAAWPPPARESRAWIFLLLGGIALFFLVVAGGLYAWLRSTPSRPQVPVAQNRGWDPASAGTLPDPAALPAAVGTPLPVGTPDPAWGLPTPVVLTPGPTPVPAIVEAGPSTGDDETFPPARPQKTVPVPPIVSEPSQPEEPPAQPQPPRRAPAATPDVVVTCRVGVEFSIDPGDAQVYVDGRFVGIVDDLEEIEFDRPGRYLLRFVYEGYRPRTAEVVVTPDAARKWEDLELELPEIEEEE